MNLLIPCKVPISNPTDCVSLAVFKAENKNKRKGVF